MSQASVLRSDDVLSDMKNPQLAFLNILRDRLKNDLISALSELAERKVGRANFYFAETKLKLHLEPATRFRVHIKKCQFKKKRNQEIAHKEQPEKWLDPSFSPIRIEYRALLKALALAVRTMKAIDLSHLGPATPLLWNEVRKKRYQLISPARVAYILLPHMSISPDAAIVMSRESSNKSSNTDSGSAGVG